VHSLGGADDSPAQIFDASGDLFEVAGASVEACKFGVGKVSLAGHDVGEAGGFEVDTAEGGLAELGGAKFGVTDTGFAELAEAGVAVVQQHMLPAAGQGVNSDELAGEELDASGLEAAELGVGEVALGEAYVAEASGDDLTIIEGDAMEEELAAAKGGQPLVGEVKIGEGEIFEWFAFEEEVEAGVGVDGKVARWFAVAVLLWFFSHGLRLALTSDLLRLWELVGV
jgi:hypothetical protein